MSTITGAALTVAAGLTIGALSGCVASASDSVQPENLFQVRDFIVRYVDDAPETINGEPWGVQCVHGDVEPKLRPGLWLGGGMRVLEAEEPMPVNDAMAVAIDLASCTYVMWAEPDLTRSS